MSYELGCNGITVYRDGSKLGVLHAGNLGGTAASAGPAEAAAALTAPSDRVKPRPQLLRGLTYQEETPLGTAYVTVNADEQDQPYEVFVNQGKTGSDVAAMSVAIGKLASLVLGLPSTMSPTQRLGEVARRLRGIGGGTPWGFGAQRARSLPDALARVLETYLDQTRSTGGQADANTPKAVPDAQLALPIAATGEFCPDCSNGLVFQEGCSKCPHCGFSKC
jgi:ribonucleoside-diphosphate reductase alpha chain